MRKTTKIGIKNSIHKINNYFLSFLSGEPAELYEASAHYIRSGGKRLRPIMVIKSCEMFGGSQEDALPAASAVELIHNFSLVHDDIMDNDDLRHGKPTVHKNFGLPLAILSGDLLFSQEYNFPTENEYIQMIAKKTAALFEVSCSLGALSSKNFTEKDVNNMADFGKNSGIAFQLIDDLIGISGNTKETGKAVGNDIREGKKTYPILLSINKASEMERSQ